MAGKAQPRLGQVEKINKLEISKRELYGMSRRNSTGAPKSSSSGISSSTPSNSGGASVVNYLNVSGGSMIGPFAYGLLATGSNLSITIDGSSRGHFNVSVSAAYTSNTYIFPASGFSGNLSWIDGDSFDGQVLKLHIQATYTVNIISGDGSTTGNIFFPSGLTSPFAANGETIVTLMFCSTLGPSGMWLVESAGSVSGANTSLSNLSTTAINQDLIFGGGMSDSAHSGKLTNVNTINFSSTGGASNLVTMGSASLPSSFHINLGTQGANLLLFLGINSETNLQLYGSPSGAQAAPTYHVLTQRTPTNGMLCGTYSFDGNATDLTQQQFGLIQGIARQTSKSGLGLAAALDFYVWSQNNTSNQMKVATLEGDLNNFPSGGSATPGLNMNGNQIWGVSYLQTTGSGLLQWTGGGVSKVVSSLALIGGSNNFLAFNLTDSGHSSKGYTFQIEGTDILAVTSDTAFGDVAYVNFATQNIYTAATAGTHALPALVKQYLIVLVNGSPFKIPLYGI